MLLIPDDNTAPRFPALPAGTRQDLGFRLMADAPPEGARGTGVRCRPLACARRDASPERRCEVELEIGNNAVRCVLT